MYLRNLNTIVITNIYYWCQMFMINVYDWTMFDDLSIDPEHLFNICHGFRKELLSEKYQKRISKFRINVTAILVFFPYYSYRITRIQCFKCCLIFNLWHVILRAFSMKFMSDLFRMKTENTRTECNRNCMLGNIYFHYYDCLYRAPCKWHAYIIHYFVFEM